MSLNTRQIKIEETCQALGMQIINYEAELRRRLINPRDIFNEDQKLKQLYSEHIKYCLDIMIEESEWNNWHWKAKTDSILYDIRRFDKDDPMIIDSYNRILIFVKQQKGIESKEISKESFRFLLTMVCIPMVFVLLFFLLH